MKKKTLIILVILTIGQIVFILMPNRLLNKEVEKVEYKEEEIKNKKMFAFLINENGNGEYIEDKDRDSWPDPSQYVYAKTECYDGEGSPLKLSETINFNEDTSTATITTKTTLYCRLYFDKANDAETTIINKSEKG